MVNHVRVCWKMSSWRSEISERMWWLISVKEAERITEMMALVRQNFRVFLLTAIQLSLYTLSLVLFLFGFKVFVWGVFWLICWGGLLFVWIFFPSIFTCYFQGNPPHLAPAFLSAFAAAGMFLLPCPVWPMRTGNVPPWEVLQFGCCFTYIFI